VAYGTEQYRSIAGSADHRRLVASVANPSASLWTVPILDRPAEDGDAKPMALPTVRALAPRFGGRSLFYLSSQGTGDGLWRFEDGKAVEVLRGSDEAWFQPPAVSAVRAEETTVGLPAIRLRVEAKRYRFVQDGRAVAYAQGTSAAQDFWLLDIATKDSRHLRLVNNPAATQSFDVTADGKQIVFDR